MSRKRYSTEQLIQKLREVEVELVNGRSVGQVAMQLGITDQTSSRSGCSRSSPDSSAS